MFKKDLCELCGECLSDCQWMEIDKEQAVAWMEEMIDGKRTPALENCVTCYACNERCPTGARPFDLFAMLQERFLDADQKAALEAMASKYVFSGELLKVPTADQIMTTCVFQKTDPHLIQGEIYDLPIISGKPYFCWILFSHMKAESIQEKHAKEFVDRLSETGAKEIVCFHDDCYAMLADIAPEYGIEVPFRPVHLSEYLAKYLEKSKDKIKPLDMKVAYQRPCASRHTPEKEHFIDKLFELAGIERVERSFDKKNALCCGGTKLLLGIGDPKPDQDKNFLDAKKNGAEAMFCLCPVCIHSLSRTAAEHNLPIIFLGDVARMAIGEIPKPKA